MPNFAPEQIVQIVDRMEGDRNLLHARMDDDMDRYHLEPFQGITDPSGRNLLSGFRKFTSNDPATTMNLALHLTSTAKRIVRVNQPRAVEQEREINNLKELFALGMLEAANTRRAKLLMRSLQDAVFGQSLFRGRICQRGLLVKDLLTGETYVDISDWDPRNVYYQMGRDGISWACEKSYKSRSDLMAEYEYSPEGFDLVYEDGDDEPDHAIYDFFDEQMNTVVLEGGEVLKPPTPHGMARCPVVFDLAETRPMFQRGQGRERDYEAHYGDSFYRSSRQMFDEHNQIFSILSVLVGRSIKQPIAVESRDGSLTLPEDPWLDGQEVSLSTDEEQAIKPLEQMRMATEAGPFMGVISAMMQRGTFPSTLFGQLEQALSGFAITQLRQGVEAPLTPHVKSAERVFTQLLDLLCDSYASGVFGEMEVSGYQQDPSRTFFWQRIDPQAVAQGGKIEVLILPRLPQDDQTRVSMVQTLREGPGGVPLIDDRYARELMEFQDPEQIEAAVWEQQAGRGSKLALAFNSMKAATEQGNQQLAAIWEEEANLAVLEKRLQMLQMMMMGGGQIGAPGGEGGVPASRTTPPSNVQPPQVRGIQARPNMQSGPNQPPGTPRPGAQDVDTRLAQVGLFGPRG